MRLDNTVDNNLLIADSKGMSTTDQKRAKPGGEFGANGEWYEGGKFIATQEDTVKAAPLRHEVSAEEQARRNAYQVEQAARTVRFQTWLAGRQRLFAALISTFLAKTNLNLTDAQWADMVTNGNAGFLASLGSQLRSNGSLSQRQALYAVKAMFGRQNKRNAAEWEALLIALTEDFE